MAAAAGAATALITCPVFEVFFGGARGGGKTDGTLGEWAIHADRYRENAIGLMVRRARIQLTETFERAKGDPEAVGRCVHRSSHAGGDAGGGRLNFAYLERDADAGGLSGPQLHARLCRGSWQLLSRADHEIARHAAFGCWRAVSDAG